MGMTVRKVSNDGSSTNVWGRFELGAQLSPANGGGGFGDKFIAVDTDLHRRVVLWRLAPSDDGSNGALAAEVQQLKEIRHPRLCPYLACDFTASSLYVILGYAPGGSVADWIADAGPLLETPMWRVLRAALE